MKHFFALACCLLHLVAGAALPAPAPWSVLGSWKVRHGEWEAGLEIRADGTMTRTDQLAGHWALTSHQGRVVLMLDWDQAQAETASLFAPDLFRGRSHHGEFELVRAPATSMPEPVTTLPPVPPGRACPAPAAGWAMETRTWAQGEAPVRLLRKEEGFCALTLVSGCFQGGGEVVHVWIGDDGWWYLGGDSQQEGVAAECVVIRLTALRPE